MTAKKNNKIIFAVAGTVCAVSAAAIAGFFIYQNLNHDAYDSPNTSIVEAGPDDEQGDDGSTVSMKYSGYATLEKDKDLITLNFINPSKSTKTISLEVVVDLNGEIITLGKSDKIRPGYKITSLDSTAEKELPDGNYNGKFIVHFYNEQGTEEIVNSEIAITVYVK